MAEFPKGIYFKEARTGAPAFVKGSISIKVAEAVEWLEANMNNGGYVNLNLKVSKDNKAYAEKDTWEPKKKEEVETEHGLGIDF